MPKKLAFLFYLFTLFAHLSYSAGQHAYSSVLSLPSVSVSYFTLRQVSSLLSLTGQGSVVSGRLMRGPLGDGVQTLSDHEGLSCSDVWFSCHRNRGCGKYSEWQVTQVKDARVCGCLSTGMAYHWTATAHLKNRHVTLMDRNGGGIAYVWTELNILLRGCTFIGQET